MPPSKPRPRRRLLPSLLLLASACSEPAPPAPPPLAVPVVEVLQRDQPIVLEMVGETRGSSDIPVRARVEGVVIGMHFREGAEVGEGDLLYSIDPEPFETAVVEAQGYLAEARTQLVKARSDLERIRPLAEMRAVSAQDLDAAQAQYDAARGSVQAAEARLDRARIELGYTRIRSPIEGRIGLSEARVGEFVGREPNPVVLNYVSLIDPIRVRFSIDERRYLRLARRLRQERQRGGPEAGSPGRSLELILADGTVHPHKGSTIAADAAVDPRTGTFTLEADFPNPDELVLAGQFARIRAVVEVREGALLIPQRSVSELQGTFRVFVVGPEGRAETRVIGLGPMIDSLVIVESGLEPGERVAVETMRLRPGAVVDPRPVELDERGRPLLGPGDAEGAPAEAGAASDGGA